LSKEYEPYQILNKASSRVSTNAKVVSPLGANSPYAATNDKYNTPSSPFGAYTMMNSSMMQSA